MKQNFLKLEVFVGILEHYDFMTADRLLKYSYGAKLNAQLSSKSLLYISGQYISNPFSSIYENTRIPMDPLFPTSGISFGIDFQLKNNINLDIDNNHHRPIRSFRHQKLRDREQQHYPNHHNQSPTRGC